jgi:hypothetical protein
MINLLPTEYRRKERTPFAVLLPMLVAVTLATGSLAVWGWMHFGELAEAESHRNDLQAVYDSKLPQLTYLASLETEKGEYTRRAQTIRGMAESRVLWSRKLDEFCDVVADDDDGNRYQVWITDFKVESPNGVAVRRMRGPAPGETVTLKGLCFSDEDPLQRFNVFHESLSSSKFFSSDFAKMNKPAGKVLDLADGLEPGLAWTVDLTLEMQSEGERQGDAGRSGR